MRLAVHVTVCNWAQSHVVVSAVSTAVFCVVCVLCGFCCG